MTESETKSVQFWSRRTLLIGIVLAMISTASTVSSGTTTTGGPGYFAGSVLGGMVIAFGLRKLYHSR
jgi:hypothetical protein